MALKNKGLPRSLKDLYDRVDSLEGATSEIAVISTADATDEATAVTLVNECKAKINEIITALNGA